MKTKAQLDNILKLPDDKQKNIIEQYELVRQLGLTNMFDMNNVHLIAKQCCFQELVTMTKNSKNYASIMKNYNFLMSKFNVRRT